MPLPLTVSCFIKIQIGFTFLVPVHLGSSGKRAVKRVCVWANLQRIVNNYIKTATSSLFSVTLGTLWRNPFHFILNGSKDIVCWKCTTFWATLYRPITGVKSGYAQTCPPKVPLPEGRFGPPPNNMVPWTGPSQHDKRQIDCFSCFIWATDVSIFNWTDKHTDTQTIYIMSHM